ncbi:hypothetical protein D3C80_1056550 [compost metagenome]
MTEIGIVLGRGPDHVQQARRLHGEDALVFDPLADFRFLHLGPAVQAFVQFRAQARRTLDDFVGPDFRTVRPGARMVHLGADVGAQDHPRVIVQFKASGILLPDVQQTQQHGLVQLAFGGEVVMQVGARQVDLYGDVTHGRTTIALFGKDVFRRQQDFLDVAPTNFDLVVGHRPVPKRLRLPRDKAFVPKTQLSCSEPGIFHKGQGLDTARPACLSTQGLHT